MESESMVAAPGTTSRAGFFTPASSASLLDELENQPPGESALPRSIIFPHTECMLSRQGMAKESFSPKHSPASQQGYRAISLPTDAVPVCQIKLLHPGAEGDIDAAPDSRAAETSSMISTRQMGANCCGVSRCTASLEARDLQVVERRAPHCVSPVGQGSRGRVDDANRSRNGQLRISKEEKDRLFTPCGEKLNGGILAKVLTESHKAQDCKDIECFRIPTRLEGPEKGGHSLFIPKGDQSERPKCSVDVTGSETWIRLPISTRTEGLRPFPLDAPLPSTLSLEQACVRTSSNRNETSTSVCRLVKCASTASTVCTTNSESLHDASREGKRAMRRSTQLKTSKSSDGDCAEGYNSDLPECTFRRRTTSQALHSSGGHSASCEGKTCVAPLKNDDYRRTVQPSVAAEHYDRRELPSEPVPVIFTTTDATESTRRQGSVSWTGVLPGRPEARSLLPIRSNRDRLPVDDSSKQEFDRDALIEVFRDEEGRTQPISGIPCTSCGHCEKLPSSRNRASNNAVLSSSAASGLNCAIPLGTPCEVNRLRKPGLYAEPADDNTQTVTTDGAAVLRITPTFQKVHCAPKPSLSYFLAHLFNGGDAAGEPCHQQDRQPRGISEAKHCQGSHTRKARRYTECTECVSSSTNLETHTLATLDKCRHTDSPSFHMLPGCRLQQPANFDVMNFRPPFEKNQSIDARGSEIRVDLGRRQRASDSLSSSGDFSYASSERNICIPLKGREIVKMIGNHLSAFERGEILDYEEVWYWGTRRKACQDEVQKSNECNSSFDDTRGYYLAVLGDHICYRFELLARIGKGSFGQVFRAFDHKKGEQVALKIVRNKSHFHAQGRIEIQVLQELVHHDTDNKANVIHMKEHFLFRNHLVITFELLSINVYDFLQRTSFEGLSSLAVRSIAIQLLQALRLLRRQRIVHCDLKPENIVLKNVHKSGIKVIDFGSSCREGEMRQTYIQSRFYRSPEVILGLTYNCAIDMWSLGCILAELQTGQPLFPGENEVDQINCVMEVLGPPPDYLISHSRKKRLFFKANGEPKTSASSHGNKRKISSRELTSALRTDDMHFVEFIRACLQWDPARRMTPDEALQHEWIKEFKVLRQRKQGSSTGC